MKEYHTDEMTIVLRDDDIIALLTNDDWKGGGTLENAKKIMAIIKTLTDENPARACWIEIPNRHASKEVLNYYQSTKAGLVAQALLLNSFGAKVTGNLYLKLFGGKPNETGRVVPVKLFIKNKEAEE
ncbi:MAG: Unknown protein [uncultured Aureispira sp.]|uniref:Uncharacterized protein n=1 Tax=uncultured Aureispira sp. TaxID=1331704 RepID=A0A6S6SNE8_9BACT|nr:MAG: Unknown protein [uncultured Aureispira sp.]